MNFAPSILSRNANRNLPLAAGARRQQSLLLVWAAFSISVLSFCLAGLLGEKLGFATLLLRVVGSSTCGLAWLLTRSLFRSSAKTETWPVVVVGLLFLGGAVVILSEAVWLGVTDVNVALRVTDSALSLISSTVLFLPLVEIFAGFGAKLPVAEKRFRLTYLAGYGLMLGLGVIWLRQSMAGSFAAAWGDQIRLLCASVALVLAAFAVWYRYSHPLGRRVGQEAAAEDARLASRIRKLMADDDVLTRADLKLADLARLTGEPDYKVTRAITGALGFQNVNRMINHYRVELAKHRLAKPEFDRLPVLTIAMDCGFGSIGPFNRAFREAVGQTPTAFRKAALARA